MRLGEFRQPIERTDCRLIADRSAIRAFDLAGRQNRPATWADGGRGLADLVAARQLALVKTLETIGQPMGQRRTADRVAPVAQQPAGAEQLQPAGAVLVLYPQGRRGIQRPGAERRSRGSQGRAIVARLERPDIEQPNSGQNQQTSRVVQAGIEVEFKPGQGGFTRQVRLGRLPQIVGKVFPGAVGCVQVFPRSDGYGIGRRCRRPSGKKVILPRSKGPTERRPMRRMQQRIRRSLPSCLAGKLARRGRVAFPRGEPARRLNMAMNPIIGVSIYTTYRLLRPVRNNDLPPCSPAILLKNRAGLLPSGSPAV